MAPLTVERLVAPQVAVGASTAGDLAFARRGRENLVALSTRVAAWFDPWL